LTGADLASWPIEQLEAHFGSSGRWYWRIARGIDEREVKPDRPYKSVSAERTFDVDYVEPEDLRRELARVAGYAWQRIERSEVRGRTVTLKVKFGDFTQITRSKSLSAAVPDFISFESMGQQLLDGLMPMAKGVRLLGLGLHSIIDEEESEPEQLGLEI
jgi:DNA polymerase IV